MRVVVDRDRCEGYGRCADTAPAVFEVGDDGQSRVRLDRPGAELRDRIERAVRLCPRQAIRIVEDA
jgi:ferredoxin